MQIELWRNVKIVDTSATATKRLIKIIVVGLCMQLDHFFPAKALLKELDIRFAYVYCKEDFETVIRLIQERRIDPSPLISSRVDFFDFPTTFERLKQPGSDLKVLLKPNSS